MLEGNSRIHLESSHANPFQLNLTMLPFLKPIWISMSRKLQAFLYLLDLESNLHTRGCKMHLKVLLSPNWYVLAYSVSLSHSVKILFFYSRYYMQKQSSIKGLIFQPLIITATISMQIFEDQA